MTKSRRLLLDPRQLSSVILRAPQSSGRSASADRRFKFQKRRQQRTKRSVVNATYSDATGAILTRLFGGFAQDFPHYISGKEFKNENLCCL
jgi:hypothetical protein